MSELPKLPDRWAWESLANLGLLKRGQSKHRPRNAAHLYGGIYPFVQTGDIRKADGLLTEYTQTYSEDGLKQSKLWPKGTLCITIAANIAETAILGFEGCFPDSVVGFIPNDPFDVRYFNYFMQTAREDLERYAPATAQKNINLKILSEVAVPIPPLPEQRRIVARIEELFSRLDAGVAALRHAKAQLQRYRQSVLAAAVTGQLTQAWREQHPDTEPAKEFLKRILKKRREQWDGRGKYKEPIEPATERGGEIPDGWVRTSTDSVCSQITDGEHIQPPYQDEGLPMLSAKHVRDGYVILNGAGLIAPDDFETCLKRCAPVKNDVLIVSVGATTGRTGIVGDQPPFALVRSVLLLRPLLIHPQYLMIWNQSPWCMDWKMRASGASAQPHLYIKDTRRMPFALPPLAEQHQIVAEVEARTTAINHLEAELDRQITRSNRLRQSTLASAFSGTLA